MKTALVIGSNGLIGRHLLFELIKSDRYAKIIALTRKDLIISHPKLQQEIISFDQLDENAAYFQVDDVFCCIGTTKAKTPDPNNYRKIDHDIPVNIGKICLKKGAKQYLMVSSMGADINSSIFYSKLKGETERDLAHLGYESFHAIRPSLLLGDRKEQRIGESIFKLIAKPINLFLMGPLKAYKAIEGIQVAKALLAIAALEKKGNHTWMNNQLFDYADTLKK
ncbi:MAG: NAD-dependent epimerase/dehydratase family protein [Bacteroidia bacterium]